MNKRKLDNIKAARARKQKLTVLGLAAALAIVVAVQAPRLLKKHHSASPPAAPAATTPAAGPGGTAAAAVAAPTSSTQLPESDVPPRRSKAQLFSFERFSSKDPFAQQVSDTATPGSATPGAAPAAAPSAASTAATPATAPQTSSTQPTTSPTTSTQKTTAAVIEVNGQSQTVGVAQAFPASSPTFKLVSVNGRLARIGIAGGSLASGSATIALQLGKTVTLMNTTDGQRYELRLVSVR